MKLEKEINEVLSKAKLRLPERENITNLTVRYPTRKKKEFFRLLGKLDENVMKWYEEMIK